MNVPIEGPAHFAPVYVHTLVPGMIADFERVHTGEVLYREVEAVEALTYLVFVVDIAGMGRRPMHAFDTLRVAGNDPVTRQRVGKAKQ